MSSFEPVNPETLKILMEGIPPAPPECHGLMDCLLTRSAAATLRAHPAMGDVLDERARQDAKWGEQNHDPFVYLAILHEESGELAQAALKARFESGDCQSELDWERHERAMRAEAVQLAAVALAIVECLDRGKWTWGGHALTAGAA